MNTASILALASLVKFPSSTSGEWRSAYQNKPLSKREAKLQEKNRIRREKQAKTNKENVCDH